MAILSFFTLFGPLNVRGDLFSLEPSQTSASMATLLSALRPYSLSLPPNPQLCAAFCHIGGPPCVSSTRSSAGRLLVGSPAGQAVSATSYQKTACLLCFQVGRADLPSALFLAPCPSSESSMATQNKCGGDIILRLCSFLKFLLL